MKAAHAIGNRRKRWICALLGHEPDIYAAIYWNQMLCERCGADMERERPSADEAQAELLRKWVQIGTTEVTVDLDFKRAWNRLADIAREKYIVPKYGDEAVAWKADIDLNVKCPCCGEVMARVTFDGTTVKCCASDCRLYERKFTVRQVSGCELVAVGGDVS